MQFIDLRKRKQRKLKNLVRKASKRDGVPKSQRKKMKNDGTLESVASEMWARFEAQDSQPSAA